MTLVSDENQRTTNRNRVLKAAKIYRLNGNFATDVTIKDMSPTGCKIGCKNQMALPNEMQFLIPSEGIMRMAAVIWRKGEFAGVRFTSGPQKAPSVKLQDGSMF